MELYRIPLDTVSAEQVVKNSRFICHLGHALSKEEALAEISTIRSMHPKANHVCWAYLGGPPDSSARGFSDDGEPHGTAGKPMLAILVHSGLGEIWTAVSRYFGGVKLGTGGLVRAYGSSVKQALELVETRTREVLLAYRITILYHVLQSVEALLAEEQVTVVDRVYGEQVSLDLLLPESRFTQIHQRLNDMSGGQCTFDTIPDSWSGTQEMNFRTHADPGTATYGGR